MLSDIYKQKLAENIEKMVEIKQKYPKTHKKDSDWIRMSEENKHYERQINNYKALINGINNA